MGSIVIGIAVVVVCALLLWQYKTGDVGYDEEQLVDLTGFKVGDEDA